LATGESVANSSRYPNGLPLDHVGIVNNGESGVYLGNYQGRPWVLTANHVGAGPFKLGATTYTAVAGSGQPLLNADGAPSDVLLFQISADPELPALKLGSVSPAIGTGVYLIGFGQSGRPDRSYWIDHGGPWIPTVVGDPAANRFGFEWTGVQPGLERWGTGTVAGRTHGVSQTEAFYTKFLDQMNNACGSAGDSGGGVFLRQNNQWQLIGMLDALSGLRNQPPGTSVLNNNINIIADLSPYRAQIEAVLGGTRSGSSPNSR
jgi:hypothetical protein